LIPYLDLVRDFSEVEAEARLRIDGVLARAQYVLGPETIELEQAMKEQLGVAAAVAVSSGTEALSLSLLALGIGAGDAVVMPSFTFFATAGAVWRAGAQPVFCDIDPASFLAGADEMRAAIEREFREDAGAWRHRASGARP
jgi:UDP-2-acetamido-2-deoxy-ribo-hexuluronate aminotransferase